MKKKAKKKFGDATRASITKEMAKPRMAKSLRIAELNLDAERIPGQARTTMIGTVDKIIPSLRRNQPGKAHPRSVFMRLRGPVDNCLVQMRSLWEPDQPS